MCPEYKVELRVTPKGEIADPQSTAVKGAAHRMGFEHVGFIRQGKDFQFPVEAETREDARRIAEELAGQLLANPVIEDYKVLYVRKTPQRKPRPPRNPQGK